MQKEYSFSILKNYQTERTFIIRKKLNESILDKLQAMIAKK